MHISFPLLIERKINKHSFKDKLKIENKQISFTTSNLHPSYKKKQKPKTKNPQTQSLNHKTIRNHINKKYRFNGRNKSCDTNSVYMIGHRYRKK